MQVHINLEEQKFWNDPAIWENKNDLKYWSTNFSSPEQLWTDLIYPLYVPHLGNRNLEIAPEVVESQNFS